MESFIANLFQLSDTIVEIFNFVERLGTSLYLKAFRGPLERLQF